MLFRNRADAGRRVAAKLTAYAGRNDVMVLALPRGGVPVGFEVARALGAPMDLFLVRKLGVPGREELAMGALASGGVRILNDEVIRALNIADEVIEAVTAKEQLELARRDRAYRDDRPSPDVRGQIVVLVDDGLATGSTMRAAATALRAMDPARVVIAVPVGSAATCAELRGAADEVICAETPEPFYAVGLWYSDFTQTTDDEVRDLLERSVARARW